MKFFVQIASFVLLSVTVFAQSPAIWTSTNSGDVRLAKGILLDTNPSVLRIWGRGVDTTCQLYNPAVLNFDTAGNYISDSAFDINLCADELAIHAASRKSTTGLLVASQNNVITPLDSSFVYSIDNSMSIQNAMFAGSSITSDFMYYHGKYYAASNDLFGLPAVWRMPESGPITMLNSFGNSYMNNSFIYLLGSSGLILEFGSQSFNTDTAFMCMVFDTVGNFVTAYAYDADQSAQEYLGHVSQVNSRVFHVCRTATGSKTYVGCSTFGGTVNWRDTIYHPFRAACTDSINNVGYVMCLSAPTTFELFSYDLVSGSLIDSVEIDSCLALSTIKSGPSGGVYMMYTKLFVNETTLEQYEPSLDLIWRGTTTQPSCTQQCNPVDFVIDSTGYAYVVSDCASCPQRTLVAKFGPSLTHTEESNPEITWHIAPNPAITVVHLESDSPDEQHVVILTNAVGQIVKTVLFTGNSFNLPVAEFPSGIYFIEVATEQGNRFTQKLIIQHP